MFRWMFLAILLIIICGIVGVDLGFWGVLGIVLAPWLAIFALLGGIVAVAFTVLIICVLGVLILDALGK